MEMQVTDHEFEWTVTIEWSSEQVTLDSGRVVWEVTDWWISEIEGKKAEPDAAEYLKKKMDAEEVINAIEEWEA